MVDMMKDVVRRGSAASVWASGFHIPAAGKTGTTNDGTDVWFIGYTPDLVTGIWMGFDRPQKIQSNAQGGRLVAPAWTSYMSEIYQRRPAPPDWPRPDGLVVREIDKYTGLLRSPFCPDSQVVNEYYIEGTEPVTQCSGMYGTATDTYASAAAAARRSVSRARSNTVRPRAAPVPTPSNTPHDTTHMRSRSIHSIRRSRDHLDADRLSRAHHDVGRRALDRRAHRGGARARRAAERRRSSLDATSRSR